MSLVEKALKKFQESKVAADASAGNAARAVVEQRVLGPVITSAAAAPIAAIPEVAVPRPPLKSIQLNRAALRAAGLMPPEHQQREIYDQYRQIKRPLIANAFGRGVSRLQDGHLIMLASALPGEGKTFTSVNLAMSMALEKDIRVLLVDADVAKPHISQILGLAKEPGLLDLLTQPELEVESLIVGTDVPGLSILPAGHRTDVATELLASAQMESLVARIGANDPNCIVLLDSPPLLLTSESRVLATVVGQVVLVVRAGFTQQQAVLDAISHLGENKSVGLVLNQSEATPTSGYYYGHAAYGDALPEE